MRYLAFWQARTYLSYLQTWVLLPGGDRLTPIETGDETGAAACVLPGARFVGKNHKEQGRGKAGGPPREVAK